MIAIRILPLSVGIVLAILAVGVYLFSSQKSVHATEIIVNKDITDVWAWISDPLKYARLYPHWIKKVSASGNETFQVEDQFGHSYPVKLVTNRELGVVDLHISLPGGEEVSRSRIYSVASGKTAIAHLGHRWVGANPVIWFFHKRNTDRDLENAKQVIEEER